MFNIVIIYFFWQELCTCMTCRFAFGNISRTPSLLHNERFLKCRLTVLLIVEGTGGFVHALGSWCERYWSGTGARQSDRSGLWIKTRSTLRLYFTRSAPRSLHAPTIFHTLRSPLAPLTCSAIYQSIYLHAAQDLLTFWHVKVIYFKKK